MDFASLSAIDTKAGAEEGVEVPFNKLDGTPLLNNKGEPVGVKVLGADSATFRRISRDMGRRRVERLQKQRGRSLTDEQLDKSEHEEIELIAKACTGWFGVLDSKDKELPFSYEGAVQMFTGYPVAREQTEAAINDRSRFIKASSQN